MNNRESPLPSFITSHQANHGPSFLPPNHIMRKREELAYQFSDADESSDSHHASVHGTTSVGVLASEPQTMMNNANNNLLTIPREYNHHHDHIFTLGKLDSDSQRSNSGITPTHLQAATASVQNVEAGSSSNSAPTDQVQEKKLQTQLEASQSRLFSLAKKIDACLSVSKTNYSDSKVLQPATDTERTGSKSSLNDLKSVPDTARSEKTSNHLGAPEIIIKPEILSNDSGEGPVKKLSNLARLNTIESQLLKTEPDQPNSVRTSNVRTKTDLVISSNNSLLPNFFAGNTHKQFETTSSLNLETTNDVQKTKESYLFAKIDGSYGNTPSPIPKMKEEEFTLQKNASKDTFKLDTSKDSIQFHKTPHKTPIKEPSDVPAQVIKSPTAENRFSFSNPLQSAKNSASKKGGSKTENKESSVAAAAKSGSKNNSNASNKTVPKLNNLTSPRAVSGASSKTPSKPNTNFTSPKAVSSSANKNAANKKETVIKKSTSVSVNKNSQPVVHTGAAQTTRTYNRSQYEFEGEHHLEQEHDLPDFMSQDDLSPPVPQKLETKNVEFPTISNPNSPPVDIKKPKAQSPVPFKAHKNFIPGSKRAGLEVNVFASEDKFELTQTISPVLNDRKSSRGMTSAYQFDVPNLSINDTKNMSFDSSVLMGKESSVKGAVVEQHHQQRQQRQQRQQIQQQKVADAKKEVNKPVRKSETFRASKATATNNTTKSKPRVVSTGKNEREYYDDELEGSFTKAYTVQKNKIIKDVPAFEERMDSDIYFRRKFKNDLQQFLDQYKPTLTEEEAEDLYDRLVVDSKRREVKQHRLEIQREKSNKAKPESLKSLPEEQVTQTFDRLAADARKRMLVQEAKEKTKMRKLQEEYEEFERQKYSKTLDPEEEEIFVSKMMHDANRRKIKLEKEQRMKFETEEREIRELSTQRFVSTGNRAKSKVREYIETQPDARRENTKSQGAKDRGVRRNKSAKSIRSSRDRKGSDTLPNLIDNPDFFDKRFVSPKNRFLSIASPQSRIKPTKESPNTGKKTTPKKEDLSSLEYLQSLRKDIDNYRSNIEDNINTIQSFDSLPTSAPRNHLFVGKAATEEKKHAPNNLVSPRSNNLNERPSHKTSSKYKNVESKVAKHIESMATQQTDASIVHEIKSHRATPNNKGNVGSLTGVKSGPSSKKSLSNVGGGKDTRYSSRSKLAEVEEKERKSSKTQIQSKFMNAQNAINFVEKLISDFKIGQKI